MKYSIIVSPFLFHLAVIRVLKSQTAFADRDTCSVRCVRLRNRDTLDDQILDANLIMPF